MESLALKYRPQVFEDLVGQESISKTLLNSIRSKKIFHSYLFYGPRGCGKTSTARILAKSLNCHSPENHNPCNKCISCIEISRSSSIDVIEIDAASYTQVQNIRDVIIDNVNLSPSRDKYKIYILDEVHMLSTNAFNALLKTVEEPPQHVVFIFATTEIHKVPLTIVSRCQTFKFKPIPPKLMVERLIYVCEKEKIKFEKDSLEMIVRSSGGSMRDSLSFLEKASAFSKNDITIKVVSELLGYPDKEIVLQLSKAILNRDINTIHSLFEKINNEGIDVINVLKELRDYFSKCFLFKKGFYNMDDIGDYNVSIFPKLARKINKIIDEVRYSDSPSFISEIFIYSMFDTIDIENIIKKIEGSNINEIVEGKAKVGLNNGNIKQDKEDLTKIDSSNATEMDFSKAWRSVLSKIMEENIPLYNILLSSEIKIEENKVIIEYDGEFGVNIITKNKSLITDLINFFTSKNYIVEPANKKKVDSIKQIENTSDQEISNNYVLKDLDNEDLFPEFEKMKKIFNKDIVKVIKNK